MLISETRDHLPQSAIIYSIIVLLCLEQQPRIRNSGELWGDTVFGNKEEDRPSVPLAFLALCLINNNSSVDDNEEDESIVNVNLLRCVMCCQRLL